MKSCFHSDIGMAGMDINSLDTLVSPSLQFLELLTAVFFSGVFWGACNVNELLAASILMPYFTETFRFFVEGKTKII